MSSPLLLNGHASFVVALPTVTVVQDGAETKVTSPLPPPQCLNLLLQGLFAVHQQLVLAQAGQQPLIQPASPADLNAIRKPKED